MAHSSNIISSIKLPGSDTVYQIHDTEAIHSAEELGISNFLDFKGTKETDGEILALTSAKKGDVWLSTGTNTEYVCISAISGTANAASWEKLGNVHNAASTTHKHDVTISGTNASSNITGTAAAQTWTQNTGTISGSGSVNIPTVSKEAQYLKVTTSAASTDKFVKSYPGSSSKLVTTTVTPVGGTASVIKTITPSTGSVTGVSGSTTASKATAGTAISVPQHSFGDVTFNAVNQVTAGTAASWSGSVSNGVLTFNWTANTPTAVTTTSKTASKATAGTAISIPQYTFSNVTVPKAAAATTVVTGVTSTNETVATAGEEIALATGSVASTGTGSSVLVGLGTATTANAVTSAIKSATLAAGTSTDVYSGDEVTIGSTSTTVNVSGSATVTGTNAASTVTGTAAAQKFTGGTFESGTPKG